MTTEDVEYSEIVELSTISPRPQEVVLHPSSLPETQFGTYICMEDAKGDTGYSRRGSHTREPGTSRLELHADEPSESQITTFKRFGVIDEPGSVLYENVFHAGPPSRRFSSANMMLPKSRDSLMNQEDSGGHDDIISLRRRLKMKSRRMSFLEYACYAIEAVYDEVEKMVFLNICFFVFSCGVMVLGVMHVDGCKAAPSIPVAMTVSGAVDSFANLLSGIATICKVPHCQECLKDIVRMARLFLFLVHVYCLTMVYRILPPEETDRSSPDYCATIVYWVAFSFFHLTTLSSLCVLVGMLTAAVCYHA